jgi:hypothetical protein
MLEKQRRLQAEQHGPSKALCRVSHPERSAKTIACDFALQAKLSGRRDDAPGFQPRFAKSASRSSVS